jgi:hypothetical protein
MGEQENADLKVSATVCHAVKEEKNHIRSPEGRRRPMSIWANVVCLGSKRANVTNTEGCKKCQKVKHLL